MSSFKRANVTSGGYCVVVCVCVCVCYELTRGGLRCISWRYLERGRVVGHGAAHPLVAAVLLDVRDPLLTLRHDLCSLQVEVFVDHLQTHTQQCSITGIHTHTRVQTQVYTHTHTHQCSTTDTHQCMHTNCWYTNPGTERLRKSDCHSGMFLYK